MQRSLHSPRLILSPLVADDAPFIFELVNTQGWLQFIGDRNVRSPQDALAYIDRMNGTENVTYWVARLKAGQVPIGVVTFMKRAYLDHFDIGFAFLPVYFGKGYAYEAAREVLSMVSSESNHPVIHATTLPGNLKSISLLTKLGLQFQKEIEVGEEKLHLYTITF